MIGRRVLWIVVIVAAISLYAFTRTDVSLAFLCASVLLPGVSLILGAMSAGGASVSLDIQASLQKSVSARCILHQKNRSFLPLGRVDAIINVKNALTGCNEQFTISSPSAPFEEKEVVFAFESEHCGQFSFFIDEILVCDILGLRGVRKRMAIREKRAVPPEIFPLEATLSGGDMPSGGGESISLPLKGQDRTEPLQIREYVEGDSPKQIHWKLSQKLGRYLVTDPSLELEQALLIMWDSGLFVKDMSARVPDALAEAALSLCLSLADNNIPYSIAWKNISRGEIVIKEVSSRDDVYEVVLGVLGAGPEGGRSLIPEFLTTLEERRYPLVAYFSCATPEELGGLAQTKSVTAFICRETDGENDNVGMGEYNLLFFTPDNYQTVLQDIII